MSAPTGFVPPPYPYDRLSELTETIRSLHGEVVDLSVGTPFDEPPPEVVAELARGGSARAYPPSVGSVAYLDAVRRWIERRFGVDASDVAIGATIGSKEFVASAPGHLHLRRPDRDTVLYPAVSYPTYAMGATLAGLRCVAVPTLGGGRLDLDSVASSDVDRALLLWVNSPANPTGLLDDLGAAARWGRSREIPVLSDECYAEFTWSGPPRTILEHGTEGVIAVHSLSKRSNLAGARVGSYAGDRELVEYLREVRKHAGMMVPGPVQAAAVLALDDDAHVDAQRARYLSRLGSLADALGSWSGRAVELPDGAFYLWVPTDDGWSYAADLARDGGALVSPGEFYGPAGSGHVRVAAVQPSEAVERVARRLRGRRRDIRAGAGAGSA
ncbi:aminotransferase class I/II-fold pyridoxal phosphate-dependent enzyme [Ilumatobacter sp.]|uniref:aminotransferase class I/II-fold pyridoxal phosphate-dependent enzyme n=1 Tax=Ilumatobacter sp. TaxID=1967498 RepID=UPI003B529F80